MGQHRLKDPKIIEDLVEAAGISSNDTVVEIGAGEGCITEMLCERAHRVLSWEIDPALFESARRRLSRFGNLELFCEDAFDSPILSELSDFVLVSNLPFSESSRFVEWLSRSKFGRAAVILQEDFAEKLLAPPGTKLYRAVSALAQMSFSMEKRRSIPPRAFSPPPKVYSAILTFRPKRRLGEREAEALRSLFAFRRKTLGRALRALLGERARDLALGFPEDLLSLRVEEVEAERLLEVIKALT